MEKGQHSHPSKSRSKCSISNSGITQIPCPEKKRRKRVNITEGARRISTNS